MSSTFITLSAHLTHYRESLTVVDNRTGKTYKIPIKNGSIHSVDFKQIKNEEDDDGIT